MNIYINGFKASHYDLERLEKDCTEGKQAYTTHITKGGNLAVVTEE